MHVLPLTDRITGPIYVVAERICYFEPHPAGGSILTLAGTTGPVEVMESPAVLCRYLERLPHHLHD